jgi:sugar lactone lactonase YvrE
MLIPILFLAVLSGCVGGGPQQTQPPAVEPTNPPEGGITETKIEIDRNPPPAVETITFGAPKGGINLLSKEFILETIIPPSKTISAPFDSAVLPDGRIVMSGNDGRLVSVSLQGEIKETNIPAGVNFEASDNGVMWYYNFVGGDVSYWRAGQNERIPVAQLPPVYTDGSIAVSPDGKAVYIAWWKLDYDINRKESALYRYTSEEGLVKILDGTKDSVLRAVEVTHDGRVYVAATNGVFRLNEENKLTLVYKIRFNHITSDGLTSDEEGNLYFSAFGFNQGVYKLSPDGKAEVISKSEDEIDVPFGLSWDKNNQLVIGVRKEKGQLISIDREGVIKVLNGASGFTTPIAIEEHPDGGIFVNGDEVGLLFVDGTGKVSNFRNRIVSYQPPAADFVFDNGGLIYYTYAAPGFDSMIVTIDANGKIKEFARNVGAPAGIDIGPDGKIYYADYEKGAIFMLTDKGESIPIQENIPFPVGLVIDSNNTLWVGAAEEGAKGDPGALNEVYSTRILRFTAGGEPEEIISLGEGKEGSFTFFDVDENGNLYLPQEDKLLLRSADGEITEIANGFQHVRAARITKDGSIYVTDYSAGALYRLR